jgi:N utilization substance protein A
VREVYLDDAGKEATVVVPDDQLALAIGKEGMNARLAHRLTGWKIDIVSDTEFAQQEAEAAFGGEGGEEGDFSGRCSAVLSNGKRCPNAALPGSRYCGVPAHQELALLEPDDEVNPIVAEEEPELEALSDTAEPEAVTEDAAEFAGQPLDVFPAGPGDAPVAGPDLTLQSGGPEPQRFVDDPDDGVPIVHVAHSAEHDQGGEGDV